jgi:hypothetical protein
MDETTPKPSSIESTGLVKGQSRASRPDPSLKIWITNQVSALAVTFGVGDIAGQRLEIYAEHLSDIPRESLQQAFWRASRNLRFFPKIAELRELAGALPDTLADGRPGPEEAWARMPKGERMEEDSIVWCEEERAAYGACRSLLLTGDHVGAHMAFQERYKQELVEARSQRKPVRWIMSAGYDMGHRLATLAAAVRGERMRLEGALNFVPGEQQENFLQMLRHGDAGKLLLGRAGKLPELPGLAGVLANMQLEGVVPEEMRSDPQTPTRRSPSDRSPEEARELREKARAQIEFLKRWRDGRGSGAA